ncbi:hypothetical protein RND71_028426 [Anisodus tanguticus]|uniref:Uncharacterized protein n=1 Tax=Anisodus tanguticus TaxID=243964 RepID=A0AAE1RL69_9SOLA|nr:hypothetical protein RND71_028426 [Anisodus tanguticus]
MASLEAQHLEISINSPHEVFLQAWWGKFYETYKSKFPDDAVFAAESFDKVLPLDLYCVLFMFNWYESLRTKCLISKFSGRRENQSYASDHTGENISIVMPSSPVLEYNGPALMYFNISDLLSSLGPDYTIPALSSLQFPEISETGGMLPFARNSGYQMQQMPTVPPEWNGRDDRPGINLGGPTQMEPNIHAPAKALPSSPELCDAVQTLDKLKLPAPASSGDFFHMLTRADSSGKDAGMLDDTNQRTSENLQTDQQIIAHWFGIYFKEISNLHVTNSKLICCHFDSQGDLLAAAGQDGKVLIWELGNDNVDSGEGHSHSVTDIRFRPNSTVFATSSFDRTVKIWDAAKPSNPFRNLVGHAGHVMSIDFHPANVGLLSSCDSNDEIRLGDVNMGDFKLILKGHVKDVRSICWDTSGNYLASVSEDSARIWYVSEGECIHELCSSGNKFQSCTFHPGYGSKVGDWFG